MADYNLSYTGVQLDAAIAAALSGGGGGGGGDENFVKLLQGTIDVETIPPISEINAGEGDIALRPCAFAFCANGMGGNKLALPNNLAAILPGTFAYSAISKIWIPLSVIMLIEIWENPPIVIPIRTFEGCSGLTIYCEAESKPEGWDAGWNKYDSTNTCPTNWGVSIEAFNAL